MTRVSLRPPPVSYVLRRSAALAAVLGSLLVAGCGALAAWSMQGAGTLPWPIFFGWALWGLAVAGAFQCWRSQFCGVLRWDGLHWQLDRLEPHGVPWALPQAPEVLVDVQTHLWVSLMAAGHGRIWLCLERSSQPERWTDLRRAVYSRARPGADNADETAPANSHGA